MKHQSWSLLVTLLILGIGAYPQDINSSKEQQKWYRQYVLQECIRHGFGEDSVFSIDISFSIANELADYPTLNSHGRMLDSLVSALLESIVPTTIADYENKKPILLRIMEYYNSKELTRDIRKILRTPKIPSIKHSAHHIQ